MPDDYRISDLTTIGTVSNDDLVEVSAVNGASETGFSSFKMPMTKLGDKVVKGIQYASDLQTNSKTIIGAINEVAQGGGGASSLDELDDVDVSSPTDKQVLKYDATAEKWVNEDAEAGFDMIGKAEGAIASFETDYASNLLTCKCEINPVQSGSGTPSPSNPRPISGFTECNIVDCGVNLVGLIDGTYSINGLTVVVSNGKITANGTATSGGGRLTALSNTFYLLAGTYFINSFNVGSGLTPYLNNADDNTAINAGDNRTFVLTKTTRVFLGINVTNGQTYNNVELTPMINIGSSAIPYEPYNGNLVTVAFGQTVYGGVLTCKNGAWKVNSTWGIINLSTLNWGYIPVGSSYPYGVFYSTINNKKFGAFNILCDSYATATESNFLNDKKCLGNASGTAIYITDGDYTDTTAFKNSLANVNMVYELATPIEIDLTAEQVETIVGLNNVFHDCNGEIEVEYFKSSAEQVKDFINADVKVDDIADVEVDAQTLSNGQVLKYDSTTKKWKNGTGGGSSGHDYSTTEQIVGTWIDGSTIYEKSFYVTHQAFTNGFQWFNVGLDCEHIVSSECIFYSTSDVYDYYGLPVAYNRNNQTIGVFNNYSGTLGAVEGYITVRYTKASQEE